MLTLSFVAVLVLALAAHLAGRRPRHEESTASRILDSRGVIIAVFLSTFIVLWYSWAAWNPPPVVHDEMAYVLQAQIFAQGKWALPSPPLPLFWEQPHVLTEPTLAAKYFPGHSLLLALGALVGWNALVPLLLQALSAALIFVLARRLASGAVALMTWVVWLFTPMVLYFGPTYFSEATTTTCWLAGWYCLLEWRTTRRTSWLLLVALCTAYGALARPLTGVAFAIPVAFVILRDVARERRWRHLALAVLVGLAVMAIIPLWSWRTTGDWRVTPLSLYSRLYMPYDVLGFRQVSTAPAHSITPDLAALNEVYKGAYRDHTVASLPSMLVSRAAYLAVSTWGTSTGVLMVFAVLGLVTLNAASAVAVLTGVLLLLLYLLFAAPASWTVYYYETVPASAFLTASGIAWAASMIGRPQGSPASALWSWRAGQWTRPLLIAAVFFTLPGIVSLQLIHRQHIGDRRHLVPFYQLLASIREPKAIVFVRYATMHNPHVAFVRNTAHLRDERVWVVYDRGDAENQRLLELAKGRTPFLIDEQERRIYRYTPAATP